MATRIVMLGGLFAGAVGAIVSGVHANNWSVSKEYAADSPPSTAICRKLGNPVIPAADRPSKAQENRLKGCDSEKLYYGIGIKPDYVKARYCGIAEADGISSHTDGQSFGDSIILMQIYANGLGVERNPDLATAFACTVEPKPLEYTIQLLQGFKTKPGKFDFCDDVSSGLLDGFCTRRKTREYAVDRDAKLTALAASLSAKSRTEYFTMKKSFEAYVTAYSMGETDLSGTMRAALVIRSEDQERDQFLIDLKRLLSRQWLAASAAESKVADANLNASYRRALAWAASKDNYTTIKTDDIRTAQRNWLTYRDDYVKFAAAVAPAVTRDTILTRLTRLRLAQLDDLSSD